MPTPLSDKDIARLVQERKPLPNDYQSYLQLKPKRGHRERELGIGGSDGGEFRLIFRQSLFNLLDFTVILAYRFPRSNEVFRLRWYNGRSHEHTNSIEQQAFYDFHIHHATERYQEIGANEDSYAEPTGRYGDMRGAIECMLGNCGFDVPPQLQGSLL